MTVTVDHADIITNLRQRISDDALTIAMIQAALAKTEAALAEATNPPEGDPQQA